jgi:hypothetical protein
MSQAQTKYLTFPVNLGKVRLSFTKVNDQWMCALTDEFMADLENVLADKMPDSFNSNKVRWVDIPDLGASSNGV